ncbi:MAG: glycosyltransferase, partial [Acidimicrobiales bacterium]
ADCLVFPSEWPEPFGLVPLEAMACGTPVVATGAGGSAEFLVDGANCLLFAPGDPAALAKAVRRLAGDPGLRNLVRDGGWQTSARLSVDQMAESYEAWHVRAAEGRLRACWKAMPAARRGGLATAVDPEVPPTLLPRRTLQGARGAVLIVSSHDLMIPKGLANPAAVLVSDVARGRAIRMVGESMGLDPVVGAPAAMPFRNDGLSGAVFELGRPGTAGADRTVLGEMHRVLQQGSAVAVVARNRHDAAQVAARLRERWRGVRRWGPDDPDSPRAGGVTWSELARVLPPELQLVSRAALGWPTSVQGRWATRLLWGPLRRLGRMVVVEARTR